MRGKYNLYLRPTAAEIHPKKLRVEPSRELNLGFGTVRNIEERVQGVLSQVQWDTPSEFFSCNVTTQCESVLAMQSSLLIALINNAC